MNKKTKLAIKEYRHKKDCIICLEYSTGKMPGCYKYSHKRTSIREHLENMRTEGSCWRCGIGGGIHQTWCETGKRYFREIKFWENKLLLFN